MIKIQMQWKKMEIMQFCQEQIMHLKIKLNPLRSPRILRHAIVSPLLWIQIFISRFWEKFCTVRWKKPNNNLFLCCRWKLAPALQVSFPAGPQGVYVRSELINDKASAALCLSLKEKKHLWASRSAVNSLLFKRLQQQIYASSHCSLPTENNP